MVAIHHGGPAARPSRCRGVPPQNGQRSARTSVAGDAPRDTGGLDRHGGRAPCLASHTVRPPPQGRDRHGDGRPDVVPNRRPAGTPRSPRTPRSSAGRPAPRSPTGECSRQRAPPALTRRRVWRRRELRDHVRRALRVGRPVRRGADPRRPLDRRQRRGGVPRASARAWGHTAGGPSFTSGQRTSDSTTRERCGRRAVSLTALAASWAARRCAVAAASSRLARGRVMAGRTSRRLGLIQALWPR